MKRLLLEEPDITTLLNHIILVWQMYLSDYMLFFNLKVPYLH